MHDPQFVLALSPAYGTIDGLPTKHDSLAETNPDREGYIHEAYGLGIHRAERVGAGYPLGRQQVFNSQPITHLSNTQPRNPRWPSWEDPSRAAAPLFGVKPGIEPWSFGSQPMILPLN
jgi:hypothetical protein